VCVLPGLRSLAGSGGVAAVRHRCPFLGVDRVVVNCASHSRTGYQSRGFAVNRYSFNQA
jgi:hypothetical protein